MSQTIAETICELIADELVADLSEVTPNADLSIDLGADSLDRAEIGILLEEHFEISVEDGAIDSLRSVQDVIDLVERLTAMK